MRLEGTLDAFSLPDIFQLLSYTKKTGTLHLRRDADGQQAHGVVHLRDGAVTGARSDVRRQALGRRIVGAGVVDDAALADAVTRVQADPSCGLARALVDSGSLSEDFARALAAEQASDAVFDLLRWPDGEFAFVVDESDPDDLGAALAVEDVVAEGQRRMQTWAEAEMPEPDALISLAPAPETEPVMTRDEWSLLSLVDGRRTVSDLVTLSGRGEYVVVSAISGLVERGLLLVGESSDDVVRRQELLSALEGMPSPVSAPPAAAPKAPPAPRAAATSTRAPVIPERPEPFTPPRQPEHAEATAPSYARAAAPSQRPAAAAAAVAAASV
ncbi:MAG: hypothetical protein QOE05_115, partial [Actinomycetota bacterium]|nr:hypothetical protein [Actinomycetota bacterium]